MTRTRNLVLGFDGTWNEPALGVDGRAYGTNVVKFLGALTRTRQVRHYESGVGTRAWEALAGGVYGYGLDKRIQGAYRFLRKRFRDAAFERHANRIFVVGFSRGAYSARRFTGLVAHSGVPVESGDARLGWEMYVEKDHVSARALKQEGRFFDVPIEFVGVWDTVKATNDRDWDDDVLSANVARGYHALAIDERRVFFPVLRWKSEARVDETWFAGGHSDVGGGTGDSGLSDVALRWMMRAATRHGLRFSATWARTHLHPRPEAALHAALEGVWIPFGYRTRPIRAEDAVHASVRTRLAGVPGYRPANLPGEPRFVE